jgi:hypothetical protein
MLIDSRRPPRGGDRFIAKPVPCAPANLPVPPVTGMSSPPFTNLTWPLTMSAYHARLTTSGGVASLRWTVAPRIAPDRPSLEPANRRARRQAKPLRDVPPDDPGERQARRSREDNIYREGRRLTRHRPPRHRRRPHIFTVVAERARAYAGLSERRLSLHGWSARARAA